MTSYMNNCKRLHPNFFPDQPFYPKVDVHFDITLSQVCSAIHNPGSFWQLTDKYLAHDSHGVCQRLQVKQHFHIPLTWNPYGYSTYRGS